MTTKINREVLQNEMWELDKRYPAFTLWLKKDQAEIIEKAARSFGLEPEMYLTIVISNQLRDKSKDK